MLHTRQVLLRSALESQNGDSSGACGLGSTMNDTFSQALAEWTAYYALMGGAAATLLGLLFVAVSVRLSIFHQREVADVRDFAAFTFGTFLVAIAVAGLALAPHTHPFTLAVSLFLSVLRHPSRSSGSLVFGFA